MRPLKRPAPATPQRRARRLRPAQRRLLFAATLGTLFVAVTATSWWLERSGAIAAALGAGERRVADIAGHFGLSVKSAEVEGRQRANAAAILAALGVERGSPILDIDLAAAKARIEAVPWVHSAAVERHLPDTLLVRIVERQPLAVWQHRGKFDVIEHDGAVVPGAQASNFPALLQVVGEDAPLETAALVDLLATEPSLASHVTAAVRVGGRRWNLQLDNGIAVALPEQSEDAAWHRLAALDRSDKLLEKDIQLVDMRLPDRLVVRLTPDAAKAIAAAKALAKKNPKTGKST